MEVTDSTKNSSRTRQSHAAIFFLVSASLFLTLSADAADFEGGIQVGVSSTDNVFLATTPNSQDDMVFRASPFFSFDHESPGFDATANYKFDWYRYTDLKSDSSFHMYDASMLGKFIDEIITFQVGASRRQVIKNPDLGIPAGRLPVTNNLADNDEIFVRPRLHRTFGSGITVDASYRYSDSRYDDSSIQDNENHDARVVLENYQRGAGITWALRYEQLETDYEVSAPWEYESASAELGYWINESTRLFASGGKESQWDDLVDRSAKDPFWEGGFAVTKGPNLTVELAAGERSFGTSWRGNIDFDFRRGSTRLSYAETPTTIGFGRDQRPSNVVAAGDPVDFLTTPGRSESYILNRLQWNLDFGFRRTSISFQVYDEERTGRINVNGLSLDDQEQSGFSTRVSWAAGPRTELVAAGSIASREYSAGSDSEFRQATLQANYRLGTDTQVSLVYEYAEEQPASGNTARDYVANVFSIMLSHSIGGS